VNSIGEVKSHIAQKDGQEKHQKTSFTQGGGKLAAGRVVWNGELPHLCYCRGARSGGGGVQASWEGGIERKWGLGKQANNGEAT